MSNRTISVLYIACAGLTVTAGFMVHISLGLAACGAWLYAVTRIAKKAERDRHARDNR